MLARRIIRRASFIAASVASAQDTAPAVAHIDRMLQDPGSDIAAHLPDTPPQPWVPDTPARMVDRVAGTVDRADKVGTLVAFPSCSAPKYH